MSTVATRHGHEANTRRTAAYAVAAFGLSLAGNVGHVALTTWEAWPVPGPVVTGKVAIAAIGPALIGAGLELANRRPPAVVGGRDLPLVGQWRDFPVVGYLAMMVIGFALSFDHLRSLSELVGVPGWASWLIPVGIDLAAFSVTLDHAQSKRALDRLDAQELVAEADRAERSARKAEQLEAERIESEARRQRLAAFRSGAATPGTKTSAATEPAKALSSSTGPTGTAEAIGDYLAEHPEASRAEVAEAVGTSSRTVQRWVTRQISQFLDAHPSAAAEEIAESVPGASVEAVELSKPWRNALEARSAAGETARANGSEAR